MKKIEGNPEFNKILALYFLLVVLFGGFYFYLSYTQNHGIYFGDKKISNDFGGFLEAEYFSFVTSTSLGYGDIRPVGLSRFLAISEVILSLLLFGILISKLLNTKQEKILEELYEVSFQERFNRIMVGLYNFRSEMDRIVIK